MNVATERASSKNNREVTNSRQIWGTKASEGTKPKPKPAGQGREEYKERMAHAAETWLIWLLLILNKIFHHQICTITICFTPTNFGCTISASTIACQTRAIC